MHWSRPRAASAVSSHSWCCGPKSTAPASQLKVPDGSSILLSLRCGRLVDESRVPSEITVAGRDLAGRDIEAYRNEGRIQPQPCGQQDGDRQRHVLSSEENQQRSS